MDEEFWGSRVGSPSGLPKALRKMDLSFIAVTPSHHCRPELAIAALRAGEFGILDLGARPIDQAADAIESIRRALSKSDQWGVRWEATGDCDPAELLNGLSRLATPYLVLAAT